MSNKSPGSVPVQRVIQADGDASYSQTLPVKHADMIQPEQRSENELEALGAVSHGKNSQICLDPKSDLDIEKEDSGQDALDGDALKVLSQPSISEECLKKQREELLEVLARTKWNAESYHTHTEDTNMVPMEHLFSVMSENRLLRQQLGSLLTMSGSSISEYLDLIKAREEAAQLRKILKESNAIRHQEAYKHGHYINHLSSVAQQLQGQAKEMEEEINRLKNENNGLRTKLSENSTELTIARNFIRNLSVAASESTSSPISQHCAPSNQLETIHQHIIEADNTEEGQSIGSQTETQVIMDVSIATSDSMIDGSVETAGTPDVQCVADDKEVVLVPPREGEEVD